MSLHGGARWVKLIYWLGLGDLKRGVINLFGLGLLAGTWGIPKLWGRLTNQPSTRDALLYWNPPPKDPAWFTLVKWWLNRG